MGTRAMRAVGTPGRILLLAALLVVSGALAGSDLLLRSRDGGVVGSLVVGADGGTRIEWVDGGSESVPLGASLDCDVDAGAVLSILGHRKCRKAAECALVKPGVGARGLECCYAVSASAAKSSELERRLDELESACGATNGICMTPCQTADCLAGVCTPR